jgi:HAD superfamily hydrolase (TIGR01509 family)
MTALLFDCDGVLADTERDGHLVAFNAMFESLALPVRWSSDEYSRLLRIGGGKERLKTLLDDEGVRSRVGSPATAAERREIVAEWHRVKTQVFTELVNQGAVPPRPGVRRLITEALDAGWTVAVASTSAEMSVRAVLRAAVGPELSEAIPVFAGDIVSRKKPDPAVYMYALKELRITPDRAIVVEDSQNGLTAALAAGLRTVVTVSDFTRDEDFTGASLVVSSLGDLDAEPIQVLADPTGLAPLGLVELSDLARLIDPPEPAAGNAPALSRTVHGG